MSAIGSRSTNEAQVLELIQAGHYLLAENLCKQKIETNAANYKVWFYLGVCHDIQNDQEKAIVAFDAAIKLNPNETLAWSAKAAVESKLGRYGEALKSARTASELNPSSSLLHANLGVAYQQVAESEHLSENYILASNHYQQAIKINPAERIALINIGAMSLKLNRLELAKRQCLAALQILPDQLDILINLTESHIQLFEYEPALAVCTRGLKLSPDNVRLLFKQGLILSALRRFSEATSILDLLSRLDSSQLSLYETQLYKEQISESLPLISKLIYLNVGLKHQICCYWQARDHYVNQLINFVEQLPANIPIRAVADILFQMISLPISATQRLNIARKITAIHATQTESIPSPAVLRSHKKIRIGYLSPDFKSHVVGFLTKQMYALHDRTVFEIHAYSLTKPDANDQLTKHIAKSCESFVDVSGFLSTDIALKIQHDEIDILVDMAGYTMNGRPEVMALRPAPIQFAYLGYPGTTGAEFIDYALIDHIVCPDQLAQSWSESVIRLPHAYCPFDTTISNSISFKRRADFSLPEHALVFACFNTNYKIDPSIFASWMRILSSVPDSVLWLAVTHPESPRYLLAEAAKFSIPSDRLIFAPLVAYDEHMKRYQMADIYLDTLWHNAHTTAIDALWQGLPVITCTADVPSSRLAASLLSALEMPELITNNLQDYENLAIYYATHGQERNAMREKLKAKRYTAPLFNTELTVRHIERAYQMAWERYQAGLAPEAFDVPQIDVSSIKEQSH